LDCTYKVRWFREDDLEYYISGLNRELYESYNEKRFRWKFVGSPFSLGFVTVSVVEAVETGRPIAFNSFLPLHVRAGEEVFFVVQGCDGFVDEAHRRRGLFQRTLIFMSNELAGKGPELLIGFNFAGSAAAARKAGSLVACDVNVWERRVNEIEIHLPACTNLELSTVTPEEASEIYESWARKTPRIHFHRTADFLRWRFEENPLLDYTIHKIESGIEFQGYVAVGIDEEDGLWKMTIEDCIPPFSETIHLSAVLRALLDEHKEVEIVEIVARSGSALNGAIKQMGFRGEEEPRYTMIMKPISNVEVRGGNLYRGELELTNPKNWHIAKSDIY
jgi:hypothetical protein